MLKTNLRQQVSALRKAKFLSIATQYNLENYYQITFSDLMDVERLVNDIYAFQAKRPELPQSTPEKILCLNENALSDYLGALDALFSTGDNQTVVINFNANHHSCAIIYRKGLGFQLMDINGLEDCTTNQTEFLSAAHLASQLLIHMNCVVKFRGIQPTQQMLFSIKIFPQNQETAIADAVRQLNAEFYPRQNPKYVDYEGKSTLLHAMANHDVDAALWLIENGANLAVSKSSIETPVVFAIIQGHDDLVGAMLEKGVDANTTYEGKAILHIAILKGQAKIVELLLQKGADINNPYRGARPLSQALDLGSASILEIMQRHYETASPPSSPADNHFFRLEILLAKVFVEYNKTKSLDRFLVKQLYQTANMIGKCYCFEFSVENNPKLIFILSRIAKHRHLCDLFGINFSKKLSGKMELLEQVMGNCDKQPDEKMSQTF